MRIAHAYKGKELIFRTDKAAVVVGRSRPGLEVDLDLHTDEPARCDRRVSRRHARIRVDGDERYWIEDLGSKRGTLLGGVNIKGRGEFALSPGVPVVVGDTTLRLLPEDGEPPAATLPVHVELACLQRLNYSLMHAGVAFFSEVRVVNASDTDVNGLALRFALPGYGESTCTAIGSVGPKRSQALEQPPGIVFDHLGLRALAEPVTVPLEAWLDEQRVSVEPPTEVEILPPNAWHCAGHELALAGFVMPNCDAVNGLVSEARSELRRHLTGARGFADALESEDPRALEKTLKAFYFYLRERYEIAYEHEPRTYAPDWQMVRFHHEVLNELEGTCIDLALLFAACLENVHRDPLILIVQTAPGLQHALVGCWRHASPGSGPVIRDPSRLRERLDAGQLLVLEAIGFARSKKYPQGMRFKQCHSQGMEYAKQYPLCYAVDIAAARDAGVVPMPFGRGVQLDRNVWRAVYRARREAERLHSPALTARHLLLGMLDLEEGLMQTIFLRLGEERRGRVVELLRKSHRRTEQVHSRLPETRSWEAVLKRAQSLAQERASEMVTEAGLARALLETQTGVDRVLKQAGLSTATVLGELRSVLDVGGPDSELHGSIFRE